MYSVLLVEDEKIELDTLKNYVNWDKLGIERVYTARGGRSALACVAECEPDIIITDIQMPGMSGTELAKLVREEGHACKIVFLTGYEKFEYARAAIQVQAEDYLMKPFNVEEVEQLVEKILNKIKREQLGKEAEQLAVGRVIEQICAGQAHAVDAVFQERIQSMTFRSLVFCGTAPEQRQAIFNMPEVIHSFLMESLYIVLLPSSVPVHDMVSRLLEKWDRDIRVAVSTQSVGVDGLRNQCLQLLRCQDALFFGTPRMIMTAEDAPPPIMEPLPEHPSKQDSMLAYAVLDGNEAQAVKHLRAILRTYQTGKKSECLQGVDRLYRYLREHLIKSGHANLETLPSEFETELMHSQTYIQLENMFTEYVRTCCRMYAQGPDSQLVSWVKRYVSEHYAEACSVEELAEGVNLSPNYLRKKFKEAAGQTILEYLTQVRLNKAAQLLRTSELKVKEVSVRVGYDNISYFTQLFSKRFGVTPNEYKKSSERDPLV